MAAKARIDQQLYDYIHHHPDIYKPPTAPTDTPTDGGPSLVKKKVILVIEDDNLLRRVVVHKLQSAGYSVIETANGVDALKQLENYSDPLDLVLTDVIMPGMNGREVVAEIKRARPTVLALYMSGYPSDIVSVRGTLDAGIDFLDKAEVVEDSFLDKIAAILAKDAL